MREPPPGYPTASPSRGAPSTFMEPLSRMIHSRLETPCTPSHLQGASTFREPYPVTNLPTPLPPLSTPQIPDWPLGTASGSRNTCVNAGRRSICAPSGRRPRPPVMLHRPSSPLFGCPPAATDVHPSVASSAVRATAPDATDAASTLSTISSATRSSRTFGGPASSTTSARQLRPRRLGPDA